MRGKPALLMRYLGGLSMTHPHPESLLKVSMATIALYFKVQGEHFLYKGSKRPR